VYDRGGDRPAFYDYYLDIIGNRALSGISDAA